MVGDTTPQLGGHLDTNGYNINFGDNDRAQFGAGNDLQIFHDGSDSFISEVGTGNLQSRADDFYVMKQDGSEIMIRADTDGFVKLFYDGSEKLATNSSGIAVTGDITATNVFASNVSGLDGTDYINFVNNTQLDFYINGSNEFRFEADGDFHADGDVVAFSNTVSDKRLKTDITKIDGAVDKVGQLSGYTFTYKADGRQSAGVIAQEVEKVLPSAVREKELPLKTDDGVAYKTVQYDQLVGCLLYTSPSPRD